MLYNEEKTKDREQKDVINKIEKRFQEDVEEMFKETKPNLERMLEYLEKVGSFDIFNGEVTLKTIPVHGEERSVILIENEQNADFGIVMYDLFIDFYGFNHFYNEEGFDQSLTEDISKHGISTAYVPFLRCRFDENVEPLERYSIYEYSFINMFEAVLGSVFCELDYDYDNDKSLYELREIVSNPVDQLFKKHRDHIVSLLTTVTSEIEFQNIKIRPLKIDATKKDQKQSRDKILDAVVIDLEDQQFVLVSNFIYDDEDEEACNIDIYSCENQERFGISTLDHLINHYDDYKNCRMYTINYRKSKNKIRISDLSRCDSAVGYFEKIKTFIESIEKMH